jgi:hypothetical protein
MLSFKKGRAIAEIKGGKHDGKTLYLTDDDKYSIGTAFFTKHGIMHPIPNPDTREVPYIAGPAGSGKSTYVCDYAQKFKKNDWDIYLFSRLDEDKSLDKLKPTRIKIDNALIDDPIDVTKEMKNGALVIFDDVDTINDKKQRDAVYKLINDILEIGRHVDVYCAVTNHLINPNDKKFGRTILNECSSITFFPKSGSVYQIKYVLKNYFGFSNDQIRMILELPSRWITLHKSSPQCVLFEKGCYIP